MRYFAVHLHAIRRLLFGPGEQFDDFVLRPANLAGGEPEQLSERGLACVKKLRLGADTGEGADYALPGIVYVRVGNLALAREDLPDANVCLKNPECIAAVCHGHVIEGLHNFDKVRDRVVVELRKL